MNEDEVEPKFWDYCIICGEIFVPVNDMDMLCDNCEA